MSSRNVMLVLGTLSLIFALALSYVWLHRAQTVERHAATIIPTQAILVAARSIPAGTLLRPQDIMWDEVPQAEIIGTSIVRGSAAEAGVLGAVTRQTFHDREPIVASALVKPGDRDFLVAALTPGYRAVSVGVDAAQGISGLVLPGDHVDVVLIQNFPAQGPGNPIQRSVATTVLHDLRVIAVDQTVNPNGKPVTAQPILGATEFRVPRTVTLEATEEQSQKLLLANQIGKIQLTLRGTLTAANHSPRPAQLPPVWASDISPELRQSGANVGPASGNGENVIEVMHGPKLARLCVTSTGLVVCP